MGRMGVSLDEERREYVEGFATFWAGFGLPRVQGRVMGLLLVSDPPERTAEEIAGALGVSRGSVSGATRSLVRLGIVERGRRPGEKKDYFRARADWSELVRQQAGTYATFRSLAERGLGVMEGASPRSRRALEEVRSLYGYLEREMPRLLERWVRERGEG